MTRIAKERVAASSISWARTKTTGLRQRAWWVIRKRRRFTLNELLDVIATGDEGDAHSNVRKYLRALTGAGVLRLDAAKVKGSALTSNGYLIYHLAIDCGPIAPVWRASNGTVYDPNTKVVYKIAKGENNA